MKTIPTASKGMVQTRHSFDAGRINREQAMYRLIVMGLSLRNADRFLRCLRFVEQIKGGEDHAR